MKAFDPAGTRYPGGLVVYPIHLKGKFVHALAV